jgi:hypothetical protein
MTNRERCLNNSRTSVDQAHGQIEFLCAAYERMDQIWDADTATQRETSSLLDLLRSPGRRAYDRRGRLKRCAASRARRDTEVNQKQRLVPRRRHQLPICRCIGWAASST